MKNITTSVKENPKKSKVKNFYITSLFVFIIMLLATINLSAQKRAISLNVNNNIESVNSEGRIYFLEIQNTTNEDIEIKLSVLNKNAEKNPDESSTEKNVILNASLLNEDGKEMEGRLKLKPNELKNFQVKVTVPAGTAIEHWNNLMVTAFSDKYPDYSPSLTLFTFIPNPEEK